ncbi:unnamed protein product, partial [Mesorhabditis belari]|uniref:Uncharacterized protein n=1 Tax=Mesorhabditis belari TaxID=2138241 RepID=A0AAF3EPZ0_9BILA
MGNYRNYNFAYTYPRQDSSRQLYGNWGYNYNSDSQWKYRRPENPIYRQSNAFYDRQHWAGKNRFGSKIKHLTNADLKGYGATLEKHDPAINPEILMEKSRITTKIPFKTHSNAEGKHAVKSDEFVSGTSEIRENKKMKAKARFGDYEDTKKMQYNPKKKEKQRTFGDYEDTISEMDLKKKGKPSHKEAQSKDSKLEFGDYEENVSRIDLQKAHKYSGRKGGSSESRQREQKPLDLNEKKQNLELISEFVPIGHDTSAKQRLRTGVHKKKFRGWTIQWDRIR